MQILTLDCNDEPCTDLFSDCDGDCVSIHSRFLDEHKNKLGTLAHATVDELGLVNHKVLYSSDPPSPCAHNVYLTD